jgi:hypothetical protein
LSERRWFKNRDKLKPKGVSEKEVYENRALWVYGMSENKMFLKAGGVSELQVSGCGWLSETKGCICGHSGLREQRVSESREMAENRGGAREQGVFKNGPNGGHLKPAGLGKVSVGTFVNSQPT